MKLLEFWPRPNVPTATVSQNFLNPQKTPIDKIQFNQRIDFNESSNSQWFGRYQLDGRKHPHSVAAAAGGTLITNSRQYMISNIRVFRRRKVNEFRFGYTTLYNIIGQELAGKRNVKRELNLPVTLVESAELGRSEHHRIWRRLKRVRKPDERSVRHRRQDLPDRGQLLVDPRQALASASAASIATTSTTNTATSSRAARSFSAVPATTTSPTRPTRRRRLGGTNVGSGVADFLLGAIGRTDVAVTLAATDFQVEQLCRSTSTIPTR